MAYFLLDVYLRSLILAAVFFLILTALKGRSAAIRHAVAIGALAILLALPAWRLIGPTRSLAWLPAPPLAQTKGVVAAEPPSLVLSKTHSVPTPAPSREPTTATWWLLAFAGPAVMTARYAHGITTLRKWVRQGTQLEPEDGREVVMVAQIGVPMTAWIGSHVILVPPSWPSWTDDRKEAALRHELAHICRADCLTQCVSHLACAMLWPNPFAWLIGRESRILSEQAADDMVLAAGTDRTHYAQALLDIARETKATFPALAISMVTESDVARRIKMVLKPNVRRGSITLSGLAVGGLLLAGLAAPISSSRLIQKPTSVTPAAQVATDDKTPVQYIISCTFLKKGVSLSGLGTVSEGKINVTKRVISTSKSASTEAKRAASLKSVNVVVVGVKETPDILKRWGRAELIFTSPVVRTLSGQLATITVRQESPTPDSFTVKLLPTFKTSASLTVQMDLEEKKADGSEEQETALFSLHTPGAVVLIRPDSPTNNPQVLGMITVTALGGERINP